MNMMWEIEIFGINAICKKYGNVWLHKIPNGKTVSYEWYLTGLYDSSEVVVCILAAAAVVYVVTIIVQMQLE